jgi:hypothetical protein
MRLDSAGYWERETDLRSVAPGSCGPDLAPSCMLSESQQRGSGRPGTRDAAGAPLAQSAERLHGKEKVYGSIP